VGSNVSWQPPSLDTRWVALRRAAVRELAAAATSQRSTATGWLISVSYQFTYCEVASFSCSELPQLCRANATLSDPIAMICFHGEAACNPLFLNYAICAERTAVLLAVFMESLERIKLNVVILLFVITIMSFLVRFPMFRVQVPDDHSSVADG
jgi:hypothetical protein